MVIICMALVSSCACIIQFCITWHRHMDMANSQTSAIKKPDECLCRLVAAGAIRCCIYICVCLSLLLLLQSFQI